MPKPCTFPTLIDNTLQINISNLKKWGYLKPNQKAEGTLTWSKQGRKTGKIGILVCTLDPLPYIELDYTFNNTPRKYKVYLQSTPSNLGKGEIWHFICPRTDRLCRILYCIDGYFLHREAFDGCMYECQTYSKKLRELEKSFGSQFKLEQLYDELNSKHFKKSYKGQPTKRLERLMNQINAAEKLI